MKKASPQRVRIEAPRDMHRTFSRHPAMKELSDRIKTAYDALLDKMVREIRRYVTKTVAPGVSLKKSDPMYGFVADVEWPEQMAGKAAPEPTREKPKAMLHAPEDERQMLGFVSDVEWPDDHDLSAKIKQDDSESPFLPEARWQRALSIITPEQLQRIRQIIEDYHLAFAAQTLGADVISRDELQRLIDAGVLPSDLAFIFQPSPGELPPKAMRFTDTAYDYGRHLGDAQQRGAVMRMGLPDFTVHSENAPRPLTAVEKQAMAWSRHNAGQYIRGMGQRISMETGAVIMNEDAEQRRRYLGTVREELEEAIDTRQAWRRLASDIGHRTKDWSRDMQRLAATEKQWAMQEGSARSMARGRKPKDVIVAKIPNPDACPDCIRLFMRGGKPRLFKLSELQANGTNVGKKRAAWNPVVGPVHPWCGCELVEVPKGWGFDENNNLVPEILLKKAGLEPARYEPLEKAEGQKGQTEDVRPHMTHGKLVPTDTLVIRVSDPRMRAVIENVVAEAPKEIFHKDVGVTLITTDTARVQNPLDEHDFAYWTGNEIRVMQTLPIERLPRVIRHELGHTLNVWLMNKLGSVKAVRAWHDKLWDISKREGWVSDYANKMPIENAAEVTRMYLFEKPRLMLHFPLQFAFCQRAYRDIFRRAL